MPKVPVDDLLFEQPSMQYYKARLLQRLASFRLAQAKRAVIPSESERLVRLAGKVYRELGGVIELITDRDEAGGLLSMADVERLKTQCESYLAGSVLPFR